MPKSAVRPMNSSKNKLNNEIILIYNSFPNARLLEFFSRDVKDRMLVLACIYTLIDI